MPGPDDQIDQPPAEVESPEQTEARHRREQELGALQRSDALKASEAAAIGAGDPGVYLPIATVRTIAQEAAGLGAGIIMQLAPTVQFPSDDVEKGVDGILDELLTPAVEKHRARIADAVSGTMPTRWGYTFDLQTMRDDVAGWLAAVIDAEALRLAEPPESGPIIPASSAVTDVVELSASLRVLDEVLQAQPKPKQAIGDAVMPGDMLDAACSRAWNTIADLGGTTALGDAVVDAIRGLLPGEAVHPEQTALDDRDQANG